MDSIKKFILKSFEPKLREWKIIKKYGYGFESNNPIMVKGVQAIYDLIKRLGLANKKVSEYSLKGYDRKSCLVNPKFRGPIDHYKLYYQVIRASELVNEIYDLYFCAYPLIEEQPYSIFDIICCELSEIKLPKEFSLN